MTPTQWLNLSLYILSSYVVLITFLFGLLPSISESFYRLGEWRKFGWLFFVVLASVSFCLLMAVPTPLIFFALCGIWWTACTPKFKDKTEGINHYTGALVGFGFGMAQLVAFGYWLPVVIAAGLCALCFIPSLNKIKILLIELICFATIIFTLKAIIP